MKHVQEFFDGFVPRLVSCSDAKLLDDVFELESLSAGVDTIGICTSGLELGQSLSRMGVASSGFGKVDGIPGMADPEVNRCAQHGADYRTRAGAQP